MGRNYALCGVLSRGFRAQKSRSCCQLRRRSHVTVKGETLHPPRIKAVIVMLAADLTVPEFEKDRDVSPELRIGGQSLECRRQQSGPKDFECDVVAVSHRIQDIEPLGADDLLALARGIEHCRQITVSADW